MAHQDRGWWAGVAACRAGGWQAGSVASQDWAGRLVSRLTRTEAGGRCIGPPGQGLVAGVDLIPGLCWN